jgi:hypothetical protein
MTMTTYTGTQEVEPGLYLNLRKFAITSVDRRGALPGTATDIFRRIPILLMLAVAPVLGLVYVMFLPFIGFAMVAYLLSRKAAEAASGVAAQAGRVRRPAWAPTLAFLSRSKPADTTAPDHTPADAWTEDVEKKLNAADRRER